MYSATRTISLIGAFVLAATTARAVSPPPDGGYPNDNTAEGEDALFSLTTGNSNTAVGHQALFTNTTGYENTAIGAQALFSNTEGPFNTATGADALYRNTSGSSNTATGASSLNFNTTGIANTATGAGTLLFSTTGSLNTATGFNVLASNTTGNNNTADGFHTLLTNRTGSNNTAIGSNALLNNSTGGTNIALGESAGLNLTTGNNNIDIGNFGVAGESRKIRIGKQGTQTATFVAGISGVTVPAGVGVIIDTNGHLGTVVSSERFKDAIKPMDKASEAILSLRPVTFRYKHELDPDRIPQFGLVAEQVEKVNPALVARDENGKPYSVRYEAVNAMLLNEFLKEHCKVAALEATLAAQQKGFESQQKQFQAIAALQRKEIDALNAALKAQGAQIQKVSDQLQMSRPVPRIVSGN